MSFTFKKALVTGGAGFIGSHLAHALVEQGCAVTVLDNLSTGHIENLSGILDRITFVEGDILDDAILSRVVPGCGAVFHQAAIVSVIQTIENPVSSTMVNDLGTLKVLEAARLNKVRRVVLASSSAVYGDDPQLPKIETMAPNPLSPYAVQKLTNEHYAQLYHSLFGLEAVCLRYFNVFGPRQDPLSPYSGVISIFMLRAVHGQAPLIYGDGHQTRDFIYVQDVVRANLQAATSDRAPGQVFNVGTARSISINTLWERIAELAGIDVTPEYTAAREGEVKHSCAAIDKALGQLAFQPSMLFEDGLKKTYAWYKQP
ncbi:MAG: SDR family oxidoreductase [Desulfobacteraceae bacterium]|jgi:UDP-glucose 4-epimerase